MVSLPQQPHNLMNSVFANQLEAFDYLNIDIMTRILTEEEKTAVEAMVGGGAEERPAVSTVTVTDVTDAADDQEDSQRESMYDPFPPRPRLTHAIHRERSLSPERYITPPRVQEPDNRAPEVTREQRREARLRSAALRSMAIAAIDRRPTNPRARREIFPVERDPPAEDVPMNSTISARAPGPLTLPATAGNVPDLPPRAPIQAQVSLAHGNRAAYNDAVLHHIDIGSLVSPYVIDLEQDPRNLPSGIPAEHAAAWRRLVQIGIMIAHYSQLVMTDCEVYIALEQVTRILTAYNGVGIRRLFAHLRTRTDVRATHIYDLHNGYKRFFIAAAAQLNQAHIAPSTRVSDGTRVFSSRQ